MERETESGGELLPSKFQMPQVVITGSAGGGYGSLVGGAGADSIIFSGEFDASAGAAGVIVFSSVYCSVSSGWA